MRSGLVSFGLSFKIRVRAGPSSNTCAWTCVLACRFRWQGLPLAEAEVLKTFSTYTTEQGGELRDKVYGRQYATSSVNDAFDTLMQWLHSRIPHTRKARAFDYGTAAGS